MTMQLRGLEPDVRAAAEWAMAVARYNGINPTVTSTYRSFGEQARLRARWEAGRSRFPANRPGESAHNFGLAFDSWVPERDRPVWRDIREYIGFRVPAGDWIHGEAPEWRSRVRRIPGKR